MVRFGQPTTAGWAAGRPTARSRDLFALRLDGRSLARTGARLGTGLGAVMVKTAQFSIPPIVASSSLRTLAYEALKAAITKMDIYGRPDEVRLDERKLSQDLGVSRTPVREALTVLEQEGFVRSEARRGVFVIKKTKKEIVGM